MLIEVQPHWFGPIHLVLPWVIYHSLEKLPTLAVVIKPDILNFQQGEVIIYGVEYDRGLEKTQEWEEEMAHLYIPLQTLC